MKSKLNSARRSKFAAVIVLAAGLLASGGTYAMATNAITNSEVTATAANDAQLTEGHKLFLANCASCHGKNAEGTQNAPTLIGVGSASVDFQVSSGRMPAQASGPQIQVKDVQFTQEQIDAMAAWVASLAPGPATPSDSAVDPSGNATRGGELFRINCAMCHNAAGAGGALTQGKYAPSLMQSSGKEIYEAMITGPQNMPVFNDANLTPKDKRDIITYLTYLQKNQSVGGLDLENIGPVAEGLFVWIFVLGGIIAITVWLGAKSN